MLKFNVKKSIPFWVLFYFWILITSCGYRLIGMNATSTENDYPIFGVFFKYFMDTYRMAIGHNIRLEYPLWQKLYVD